MLILRNSYAPVRSLTKGSKFIIATEKRRGHKDSAEQRYRAALDVYKLRFCDETLQCAAYF